MGPHFSRKGRFGAHLKAGSGPHVFHTIKMGISEENCGDSEIGKKVANRSPHGARTLFLLSLGS